MEKQTIQNLIDTIILEKLKEQICLDGHDVVILAEELTENSKDLDEIIDMIMNSKRYNYIKTKRGDDYIFGTSLKQVMGFIDWSYGYIRDDDTCWREYITCDGRSYQLNYFVEGDE